MSFSTLLSCTNQVDNMPENHRSPASPGFSERIGGVPKFKSFPPPSLPISPPVSPSIFLSIPPGLTPTQLLDSPVLLSISNILSSPTTGSFPSQFFNWRSGSGSACGADVYNYQQVVKEEASNWQKNPRSHQEPNKSSEFAPSTYGEVDGKTNIKSIFFNPVQAISPGISAIQTFPVVTQNRRSQDGYNWKKYGQKQLKGSKNPRSYYKCTYPKCQTKKHVESSLDGQIEEIVYKGTHNHPKPQTTRTKTDAPQATQASREAIKVEGWSSWANYPLKMNSESLEISSSASVVTEISDPLYVGGATTEQMESAGTPDNSSISFRDDEFDLNSQRSRPRDVGFDDDEHDTKRWRKESENDGISASCRTVREPRVVIQTISDIDILEDGYKWRKYGQKVVKGNHNPRSYYKCTKVGCSVRKHVERASHDAKAVITSYEGTHNHDIPATRVSSSHGLALMLASDNNLEVPTMSFNNHMRSNSSFGGRTHASVEEYTPFTLEMLQSPHSFGYSGFENSCGTFMGVVNNMEIGISKEEAKEEPRDDSFFESLLY